MVQKSIIHLVVRQDSLVGYKFLIAMVGSVWATIYIVNLPEIGGLSNLLAHENVSGQLSMLPDFGNKEALITLFIVPLAVQWWSTWYPGAEPGGGGASAGGRCGRICGQPVPTR